MGLAFFVWRVFEEGYHDLSIHLPYLSEWSMQRWEGHNGRTGVGDVGTHRTSPNQGFQYRTTTTTTKPFCPKHVGVG
jgi:hypothetical protein